MSHAAPHEIPAVLEVRVVCWLSMIQLHYFIYFFLTPYSHNSWVTPVVLIILSFSLYVSYCF